VLAFPQHGLDALLLFGRRLEHNAAAFSVTIACEPRANISSSRGPQSFLDVRQRLPEQSGWYLQWE
jgi:hypothetical protein